MSLAINGTDGIDFNADDAKIKLGAGDDLQLFHDGNNSVIDNNTGDLLIRMLGSSGDIYLDPKIHERGIKVIRDGSVELYYDNSKKLETTSGGVSITGALLPAADDTHDLGSSSYAWNNLYVNDLHFSNNPDNPNSVDGTWGDWTLQEGEEDIFMINNRSGKKYKMVLQEVS